MICAEFETMDAAAALRASAGGWIFATQCGRFFWFNLRFTITDIVQSDRTRGLSGRFV